MANHGVMASGRLILGAWLTAALVLGGATVEAGVVVNSTLFNAETNVAPPDESPGQGYNFTATSRVLGTDDPEGAFGNNDGAVEGGSFIFGDALTADNGNGTLGDGGETVSQLSWNTRQNVLVAGMRVQADSDGAGSSFSRGTQLMGLNVQGEQDRLYDNNAANGPVDLLFTIPQLGNTFSLQTTRQLTTGERIVEVDAIVPDPLPGSLRVAPIHFNATTNTGGDEAPGLGFNYASTALIPGDTVQDAFGNNDGGIEPSTVIFSDSGAVADNGNNTFDVGTETIDEISWQTTSPLTLYGFEVNLEPDGATDYRGTELVRFFVNGSLVDTIDYNGLAATIDRVFDGGPVVGSSFAIQLTRSVAGGGPRVFEINAILAQNVAPTAEANGAYVFSAGTTSVNLSSTGSADPEGIPLTSYNWQVSGGPALSGSSPALTLVQSGLTSTTATNTVALTVTDFESATGNDSATLSYSNVAPSPSATAVGGPAYSITFSGSFGDADLAINSLLPFFENLDYEFDLAPAATAAEVGSGAGMFASGTTTASQTTPGLLGVTLNYSQLISLFGGEGVFDVYANVVDQAGSVQSFQFQVHVVPEPSSLLLWLALIGGTGCWCWRRRLARTGQS